MKETWIVGVSGGPDSMYLLHHLQKYDFELVVAHVDYQIRETSHVDAQLVKDYANKHHLLFEMTLFDQNYHGNFQKVARDFRYAYFKGLKEKYNAKGVIVGHHQDDDLETFLMQKSSQRETHVPGMSEHTQLYGMHVWRPLLSMDKETIVSLCHTLKIPFVIDESNLEPVYTRNRIRLKLENLSKEQKDALLTELYEEKEKNQAFLDALEEFKIYTNPFKRDQYLKLDSEYREPVLRMWLEYVGIEPYEMTHAYLQHLDCLIESNKAHEPIQDQMFSVSYGEICVYKDNSFVYQLDELWYHKTDHYTLKPDGEVIEGLYLTEDDFPIKIRSYKKGDKITMRYGTKSINRFFIDRKIPVHKRHSWLVIENSVKDIVFVSELGCDVRHYSNNPNVFVIRL